MKSKILSVLLMGMLIVMSSCGSSDSGVEDDINDNPIEKPEEPKLDLSKTEDYVDLGLSVKWAKWNFGAKSIDEQGDLYAWGELETKSKYISANYQKPAYLLETGDSYNRSIISGTQWDVVAMKNQDGSRIPTIKEYEELVGYCDITTVFVGDAVCKVLYYVKSTYVHMSFIIVIQLVIYIKTFADFT